MFFVVVATDKPGALSVRMANKAAHMAHLDAAAADVQVLQSGPWTDAGGVEAGSIIVLKAANTEAVERFLAADPYRRAGLFAHVEIRPWKWSRGNPYRATNTP